MNTEEKATDSRELQARQTNTALGLFLLFFGLVILTAVFFTPTLAGKIANLVAGALLSLTGGGMILVNKRKRRV